jgi:hypothetical protein
VTLDEWVQIALAVGTVAAALLAYYAIRRETRKSSSTDTETRVKELARGEQEPLKDRISHNDIRIAQIIDSVGRMESVVLKIDENVHDSRERLASVEALQRQHIEQITMSLMKQLHQPDPRRARVDHLLEQYMEGTITSSEVVELKKYLVKIRNLEPTEDQVEAAVLALGFPVFPGEQTNAAILLGTMDLVDPARLAAYGNSVHRSEPPTSTPDKDADND